MYPLYTTYAHLWPMLCPLESYESEMMEWCEIIEEVLDPKMPFSLLDLGTGGAHHLYHLTQNLSSLQGGVAVDLSPEMLKRAEQLAPQFETLCRDMTTLRLDQRFQLITVHDSFCYLTSEPQVEKLFETISRHLNPGGLALVRVDAVFDSFKGPYRYLTSFDEDEHEVTLTHYEWHQDPSDTVLEVIYLFLERRGQVVSSREERHRLGLFSKSSLLTTAERQGLRGQFRELEPWDEERENLLMVLRNTDEPRDARRDGI